MIRFILAGIAIGAAHIHPRLSLFAWLGAAALPWALSEARAPFVRALGLMLAGLFAHAIALHWFVLTAMRYQDVDLSLPAALGAALGGWTACTLVVWGPAALTSIICPRLSLTLWLPPAIAIGEALRAVLSGFSQDDYMYSQWQTEPVLRCLAFVGWTPTLLLLLHISMSFGEAILCRRVGWRTLPASIALLLLLTLPGRKLSQPPSDIGVSLASESADSAEPSRSRDVRSTVRLLIWPEGVFPDRIPGVEEGPLTPLCWPGLPRGREQLLGALTRSRVGLQNSVLHVGSDGCIDAARAKSTLAPIGERRFAGLGPLGEELMPGQSLPLVNAAGWKIIPLLCIEVFDRALVARGRRNGGTLIAVLASDLAYVGSEIAIRQSLGALALRSAEAGVPSVRAALGGVAAFIDAGGHVVCSAMATTGGVLTCEGSIR